MPLSQQVKSKRQSKMGTKNNPGLNDCYSRALPDEPMFVLLARDIHAPEVIRFWMQLRSDDIDTGLAPPTDTAIVNEAEACTLDMEVWRERNDGKWRAPVPLFEGKWRGPVPLLEGSSFQSFLEELGTEKEIDAIAKARVERFKNDR